MSDRGGPMGGDRRGGMHGGFRDFDRRGPPPDFNMGGPPPRGMWRGDRPPPHFNMRGPPPNRAPAPHDISMSLGMLSILTSATHSLSVTSNASISSFV